jgi:hypothetical protein
VQDDGSHATDMGETCSRLAVVVREPGGRQATCIGLSLHQDNGEIEPRALDSPPCREAGRPVRRRH